jgi:hypothetical protein
MGRAGRRNSCLELDFGRTKVRIKMKTKLRLGADKKLVKFGAEYLYSFFLLELN